MDEHKIDVNQESSPEEVETTEEAVEVIVSEDEKTPEPEPKEVEEKVVPYSRFKEVNDQLSKLKEKPEVLVAKDSKPLDVEDYIDISASLEGLDQREKEKLAREHKLTGRPLSEIRKDEDFQLWQTAYQAKAEKEKSTLTPSGTQSESDKPKSLTEKLAGASIEEKEKILKEANLFKEFRPRADRTHIGTQR